MLPTENTSFLLYLPWFKDTDYSFKAKSWTIGKRSKEGTSSTRIWMSLRYDGEGALQAVRDTDLHENNAITSISSDMSALRDWITQSIPNSGQFEPAVIEPLVAKPLAIKRVLAITFDNAVKYGQSARMRYQQWFSVRSLWRFRITAKVSLKTKLELVLNPTLGLQPTIKDTVWGSGICRNIHVDGESHYSQLLSGGEASLYTKRLEVLVFNNLYYIGTVSIL